MGELCDTCGDTGVAEALKTCDDCKINREHLYCMHIRPKGQPPYTWFCKPCTVKENLLAATMSNFVHKERSPSGVPKKLTDDVEKRSPYKWEKEVTGGKVKYIPTKEALMMTTGVQKNASSKRTGRTETKVGHSDPNLCLNPGSLRNMASVSAWAAVMKPKAKIFSSLGHESLERSGCARLHISSAVQREEPSPTKEQRGHKICTNVEPRNAEIENSSPMSIPRNAETQNGSPMSILPNVEKFFKIQPAKESSWRGYFKFFDCIKRDELNEGILAYPPNRSRRKVFEFSKKMPEVLQFEMLPRSNFWRQIFQDDIPDKNDIALYFFSSNKRSEAYSFLLEYIDTHDLLMRCFMNGVELLIMTSKLLHLDSQRWREKYFLWGCYRRVKECMAVHKKRDEHTSLAYPLHCISSSNNDTVDMDIDMMGGKDVGRVDRVIPRGDSNKKDTAILTNPRVSDSKDPKMDFSNRKNKILVVEKQCGDIPPGFEGKKKPNLVNGNGVNPTKLCDNFPRLSEASGAGGLHVGNLTRDSDSQGSKHHHHHDQVTATTIHDQKMGTAVKAERSEDELCKQTERKRFKEAPSMVCDRGSPSLSKSAILSEHNSTAHRSPSLLRPVGPQRDNSSDRVSPSLSKPVGSREDNSGDRRSPFSKPVGSREDRSSDRRSPYLSKPVGSREDKSSDRRSPYLSKPVGPRENYSSDRRSPSFSKPVGPREDNSSDHRSPTLLKPMGPTLSKPVGHQEDNSSDRRSPSLSKSVSFSEHNSTAHRSHSLLRQVGPQRDNSSDRISPSLSKPVGSWVDNSSHRASPSILKPVGSCGDDSIHHQNPSHTKSMGPPGYNSSHHRNFSSHIKSMGPPGDNCSHHRSPPWSKSVGSIPGK